MPERSIHFARAELPPVGEDAAAARARLGALFPRAALRRMTHLGLLTGSVLDGCAAGPDDAVVYASSYAETRALEDYLGGFPTPSPQLFQTSIHPSAVQQVLIGRQQPIRRFWPMTGRAHLVEHALLAALIEPAARVLFTGGEERGTWLLEQGMASGRAFAFALGLGSGDSGEALGRVRLAPGTVAPSGAPSLEAFAEAIGGRRPLAWDGFAGRWSLDWK